MPPAPSALPRPSSPPPAPPQPVRRQPARPAPSHRSSTEPTPPQAPADKRRTAARGGGSYTGCWFPVRGRFTRCLGAPRPWAPPPDRQTAGQWAPAAARAGRAGALRDRTPAGRGRLRAGTAAGRRGAARRGGRTKPAADRRTEGEKDGDARRGSALFALSQRVGRVPEPHLSPPAAAPTPPGSRGARLALWAGPQGKGPGRRDLGSIQSPAFQRGPALVLELETPAEHLWEVSVVLSAPPRPSRAGELHSAVVSPGFPYQRRVQPQNPHPPTTSPPQASAFP